MGHRARGMELSAYSKQFDTMRYAPCSMLRAAKEYEDTR
jgi:hypothetical protein